MVEPRVTVFLGSDESAKHARLMLLQKKSFPASLKELNTTVFYADDKDMSPVSLQEALSCLPTGGAPCRLVIVKAGHCLKKGSLDVLCAASRRPEATSVVIVDVPDVKAGEKVVRALDKAGAPVVRFKSDVPLSVFDLGRAIIGKKPQEALRLLAGVMEDRQRPEKLMGALLWQWEKAYRSRRISLEAYRKGLALMAETDRRFKTSSARRQGRLLLELLVVRLSYLA